MNKKKVECIHSKAVSQPKEKPEERSSTEISLQKAVDIAQSVLTSVEQDYQEAVTQQIETKAALDKAKREVEGLEIALAHIRGESIAEPSIEQNNSEMNTISKNLSPEKSNKNSAEISPERRRELQEAQDRLDEKNATGPECLGCKKKGTLQQTLHSSGTPISICSYCGSMAV